MASLEWDDRHDALAEANSAGTHAKAATVVAATRGAWFHIGPHQPAPAARRAADLLKPFAQWAFYHPTLHQPPHLPKPPPERGRPILYHLQQESARKKCARTWATSQSSASSDRTIHAGRDTRLDGIGGPW